MRKLLFCLLVMLISSTNLFAQKAKVMVDEFTEDTTIYVGVNIFGITPGNQDITYASKNKQVVWRSYGMNGAQTMHIIFVDGTKWHLEGIANQVILQNVFGAKWEDRTASSSYFRLNKEQLEKLATSPIKKWNVFQSYSKGELNEKKANRVMKSFQVFLEATKDKDIK